MDSVGKAGRLNRPSSRIRRQRSHEWKDYSSSDNDEDLEKQAYRYEERQYDEPSRNNQDLRKDDSGAERHNSPTVITSNKGTPNQYPGYNSLPRPGHGGPLQGATVAQSEVEVVNNPAPNQQVTPLQRDGSMRGNSGNGGSSRGRMYLSLHRGPSSSSTSDNNSDATCTDSEPITRRGGNPSLEAQNSKFRLALHTADFA
ncbi:uncharacterized protein LOC118188949 [Stegodyphus dumicola]|uniref:uncharacterized protein LOC118188949 n=1 Tax=Stegodyphus dumicola TaxID=202533 RepID=UPI0015B2E85D|nr:uncharacterized protein LOC118188949 [Stegodyphus dumicola]